MASLNFGYLFKRKNITFHNKKYEVWEYQDFVVGIKFTNIDNNDLFIICSEKYSNLTVSQLNAKAVNNENVDYVVIPFSLEEIFKGTNQRVDLKEALKIFQDIRYGYCTFNKITGGMKEIKDKDLLEYLHNNEHKNYNSNLDIKMNISEMYARIKETIVSQDEQIGQILTAIYKNQKLINSKISEEAKIQLKENILICGPTGTGKTEILKRIASLYNVPIVIENAPSFSETGYVGREISEMLRDLYLAADEDINRAECGILVIDEFDKLAECNGNSETHVSRIGVQRSLLKLFEDSTWWFNKKGERSNDDSQKQKFSTKNLTIVCIGAFSGITNNLNRKMGFNTTLGNMNEEINYKDLTMKIFVDYGIMKELMGRFSKIVAMNSLSKEDLKNILINSNFSPLYTYKELFNEMNIEFEYSDDFIDWVAEQAVLLKSGARSLKTIVDQCISGALFNIFEENYSKIELIRPYSDKGKPYILTKNF